MLRELIMGILGAGIYEKIRGPTRYYEQRQQNYIVTAVAHAVAAAIVVACLVFLLPIVAAFFLIRFVIRKIRDERGG